MTDSLKKSITEGELPSPNEASLLHFLGARRGEKIDALKTESSLRKAGYTEKEIAYVIGLIRDHNASVEPVYNPNEFQDKARAIVQGYYLGSLATPTPDENPGPLKLEEIYVVWFSKTLQNWKALLSTTRNDGQYFEITYNGDKEEAYLDSYVKLANHVIPDHPHTKVREILNNQEGEV